MENRPHLNTKSMYFTLLVLNDRVYHNRLFTTDDLFKIFGELISSYYWVAFNPNNIKMDTVPGKIVLTMNKILESMETIRQ
jgi:hypothetical protein